MTNESENKLETLLNEWFETVDLDKPHFWKRNKIARLLREKIEGVDHWKNVTRSDSKRKKVKIEVRKILFARKEPDERNPW